MHGPKISNIGVPVPCVATFGTSKIESINLSFVWLFGKVLKKRESTLITANALINTTVMDQSVW